MFYKDSSNADICEDKHENNLRLPLALDENTNNNNGTMHKETKTNNDLAFQLETSQNNVITDSNNNMELE